MNNKEIETYNMVESTITPLITQKIHEDFQYDQKKKEIVDKNTLNQNNLSNIRKENQQRNGHQEAQGIKYKSHEGDPEFFQKLKAITDQFVQLRKSVDLANVKQRTKEQIQSEIQPCHEHASAFLLSLSKRNLPVKFTVEMLKELDDYKATLINILKKSDALRNAGICSKGKIKKEINMSIPEVKIHDAHIVNLQRLESRDIILPSGEVVVEKIIEVEVPPDENKIRELVAKYIKEMIPKEQPKEIIKEVIRENPKESKTIIKEVIKQEIKYLPAEPDLLTKAHQAFFGFGIQRNYIEALKLYKECDQKGNLVATDCLGQMYLEGVGVKKDIQKAVEYYIKSASKNDPEGLYRLGTLLERKKYIEFDDPKLNIQKAIECYQKSAAQDHIEALTDLGYLYEHGINIEQNLEEAHRLYQRAVVYNSPRALNNLGIFYYKHMINDKNRDKKAFEYFKLAAEQGYVKAYTNLAICYEKGRGVSPDIYVAKGLFELAAEMGDVDAKYNYAYYLLKYAALQNSEDDYNKAGNLFRQVINEDELCSDAHYYLGFMFENGLGVDKDFKTAIRYYLNAAKLNNAKAWSRMGNFYAYGLGINGVNKKAALSAYEKAAELGDSEAMNNLGVFFEEGIEVPVDYAKAHEYYKSAAILGNPKASLNIGLMYEKGRYVEKNLDEALVHYIRAAEGGNLVAQSIVKQRDPLRLLEYKQNLDLLASNALLVSKSSKNLPNLLIDPEQEIVRGAVPIDIHQNEPNHQVLQPPHENIDKHKGPSTQQVTYLTGTTIMPATKAEKKEKRETSIERKDAKKESKNALKTQGSYGARMLNLALESEKQNNSRPLDDNIKEAIFKNMENIKTPPSNIIKTVKSQEKLEAKHFATNKTGTRNNTEESEIEAIALYV